MRRVSHVFHRNITERRRAVEIVLLDLAPKALELADDISLRTMNSIRPWRARSDFDQSAHVFVSLGPVEATSNRRGEMPRKDSPPVSLLGRTQRGLRWLAGRFKRHCTRTPGSQR